MLVISQTLRFYGSILFACSTPEVCITAYAYSGVKQFDVMDTVYIAYS